MTREGNYSSDDRGKIFLSFQISIYSHIEAIQFLLAEGFQLACVPVHSPVVSGLCNILKFPVQPLSTKLVKFMHTSV